MRLHCLSVLLLLMLCTHLHAVEGDKENQLPGNGNVSPVTTMPDNKPEIRITKVKDTYFVSGTEIFRWSGLEQGYMTEEHVKLMQDPRYGFIDLFRVCGEKYMSPSFYKDHLIVSSETIHPGVRFLRAQACGLIDNNLRDIGRFTNLKYLLLAGNGMTIESVRKISQLTQLEVIDLSCNRLNNESLQLLSQMPNLKELSVACNHELTDEGTLYIPDNRTLYELNIESTHISYKKYKSLLELGLEILYFPDSADLLG